MLRLSMQLHKWIALIVGVQVLFWVAGGLVMTAIPIERVRSEHRLVKPSPAPLALGDLVSVQTAAARAGVAPVEAALKSTARGPVWSLKAADGEEVAVSARTGRRLARMSEAEARAVAARAYKGPGRPVQARFYAKAPAETGKEGPLWRVDFNDAERTAFYLAPETGEVATRRSNVWRLFDFFWRLHILDLKNGEDFNNPWVIGFAALTLPVVITGFILLWIRLARDLKMLRTRKRPAAAE
ncbi:MAG: PepSY domain-containing protein [Pseudomonadota bacterium]|nr:PepSY domain-containing protein [Pseudomonadota bacterium]